jgi:peptide/nickel transport system substrate-binding protein
MRNLTRQLRRAAVLALAVGLAVQAGAAPAPAAPAATTLTLALFADPVSLDPHRSNDGPSNMMWHQLYNTLVDRDEKGEIVPSLAVRWQRVGDRSWRFFLRQGVKFHDGSEMTAEDVKFSLERLINPATRSPAAFLLTVLDRVEVEGRYQVLLVLKNPFAPLLFHLMHKPTSIVPAALVRAGADEFARRPVGTGPFRFGSYVRGDRVELVRNPDYWGGAPRFERVIVRIVPDASTSIAELESGGVAGVFNVPAHEVARLQRNRNLNVLVVPSHRITALVLNTERPPFNDRRVRLAASYAIDRRATLNSVEAGLGIPAASPLSPLVFGHNDTLTPYPRDPARARQLLAEAGHAGGLRTEMLVWNIPASVKVAEVTQAQLREAGIDVALKVTEFGAALREQYAGNFTVSTMAWGTVTLDGDYSMYALFHSDSIGPAGNWGRYRNAEVDRLIMTGRTNGNPAVRRQAYLKAQEIIAGDAPWVFLYHPSAVYALRSEVRDVTIPPQGYVFIDLTKGSIAR